MAFYTEYLAIGGGICAESVELAGIPPSIRDLTALFPLEILATRCVEMAVRPPVAFALCAGSFPGFSQDHFRKCHRCTSGLQCSALHSDYVPEAESKSIGKRAKAEGSGFRNRCNRLPR
jgi:hypothetical protein